MAQPGRWLTQAWRWFLDGVGYASRRVWVLGAARAAMAPTEHSHKLAPAHPWGDVPLRRVTSVTAGRGDAFRQRSGTTCGSSTLAMFRVLTDPPYAEQLLGSSGGELAAQWAALERALHERTNRGGRWPWPKALGTPPWGLRDALDELGRDRGLRFTIVRVDGRSPQQVSSAVDRAAGALACGIPVPLYVGDAVLPRHVVLVTAAGPGWVQVYDPAIGQARRVRRQALTQSQAAISDWDVLWAALLPVG